MKPQMIALMRMMDSTALGRREPIEKNLRSHLLLLLLLQSSSSFLFFLMAAHVLICLTLIRVRSLAFILPWMEWQTRKNEFQKIAQTRTITYCARPIRPVGPTGRVIPVDPDTSKYLPGTGLPNRFESQRNFLTLSDRSGRPVRY